MISKIFTVIIILVFISSCSTSEKIDAGTAEGAFKIAQKYEKDERYEEALSYLAEVKNKYPYSNYAVASELMMADIHFKRESYLESESAYRLFKEFHPKNEKIDYVTYRLGLSYFKQLPETIDRDLSVASQAILYFDEVTTSYPNSKWAQHAKEHKQKALKMLAEKEFYIANFYFKRKKFDSALGRFEELLEKYPGLGLDAKALYGATISSYKIKNMKKAKDFYSQLGAKYANSNEFKEAKDEVGSEL